jgi:hypothetical protein
VAFDPNVEDNREDGISYDWKCGKILGDGELDECKDAVTGDFLVFDNSSLN